MGIFENQLAEEGEEEVRRKLALGRYGADKRRNVQLWLDRLDNERAAASKKAQLSANLSQAESARRLAELAEDANSLARDANDKASTANAIATTAIIIAIVSMASTIVIAFVSN